MFIHFRVPKEIIVSLSIKNGRIGFDQLRRLMLSIQNMRHVLYEKLESNRHNDF